MCQFINQKENILVNMQNIQKEKLKIYLMSFRKLGKYTLRVIYHKLFKNTSF